MEKDGTIYNQHSFAKTHISVGIAFWIYTFIHFISGDSQYALISFMCSSFLLIINLSTLFLKNKNYSKFFIVLRYIQLTFISYTFLLSLGNISAIFLELLIILITIEILLLFDITDSYVRKIVLLITSMPSILMMLFYLIVQHRSQEFFI